MFESRSSREERNDLGQGNKRGNNIDWSLVSLEVLHIEMNTFT